MCLKVAITILLCVCCAHICESITYNVSLTILYMMRGDAACIPHVSLRCTERRPTFTFSAVVYRRLSSLSVSVSSSSTSFQYTPAGRLRIISATQTHAVEIGSNARTRGNRIHAYAHRWAGWWTARTHTHRNRHTYREAAATQFEPAMATYSHATGVSVCVLCGFRVRPPQAARVICENGPVR